MDPLCITIDELTNFFGKFERCLVLVPVKTSEEVSLPPAKITQLRLILSEIDKSTKSMKTFT